MEAAVELLRRPGFRYLFLSRNISRFGDKLTLVALAVYAYDITRGSGLWIALILGASMLPEVVIGWGMGAFIDRWHLGRVMWATDYACVLIAATLALAHTPLTLFIVATLLRLMRTVYRPAYQKAIPILAGPEGLFKGNALNLSAGQAMDMAGYLVAALLVPTAGPRPLFIADAGTYLLSGTAILLARWPAGAFTQTSALRVSALWAEIREGLGAVFSQPVARALLMQAGFLFVAMGVVNALEILMLPRLLRIPATDFGWLLMVQGAVMTAVGLLTVRLNARFTRGQLINTGLLTLGISLGLILIIRGLVPALLDWGLMGLSNMLLLVPLLTWYQSLFEPGIQGRAVGAYEWLSGIGAGVAPVVAGPLVHVWGLSPIVGACALMLLVSAGLGYRMASLRHASVDRAASA